METQNVTIALPRALLRKVKHLAVERETSISGLLVRALEDLVRHNDDYQEARERALNRLRNPTDLGLGDKITWTRDELHERR